MGDVLPVAANKKRKGDKNLGQYCLDCENWEESTYEGQCRWCYLRNMKEGGGKK